MCDPLFLAPTKNSECKPLSLGSELSLFTVFVSERQILQGFLFSHVLLLDSMSSQLTIVCGILVLYEKECGAAIAKARADPVCTLMENSSP